MGQTRDTIQKSLERMLRARGGDAGEDYVTLRNDRFVIPVRAAERRQVQGVVHAASATGSNRFRRASPLKPLSTINRLVQLSRGREAARDCETNPRRVDRAPASKFPVPLQFAVETIAKLDSVFARARFARDFDCTLPQFTGDEVGAPSSPQENSSQQASLEMQGYAGPERGAPSRACRYLARPRPGR